MNQFYSNLSHEIKVGNMTLKNRVQFTPNVPCLGDGNGHSTTDYVAFMGMQGRTGTGFITIGGTPVGPENP